MADDSRLAAIRRAILREWRGADEPEHPDKGLHRAGEFLSAILKKAGASEGIDEERLRDIWVEVAGEFIARHASPQSLKSGCLTLHVLQPSMRFHLEQMRGMLLQRLQETIGPGSVKSIRFSLG